MLIKVNGWFDRGEIHDKDRITYLCDHIKVVLYEIRNGSNVCAYAGNKHNRNNVTPISQ